MKRVWMALSLPLLAGCISLAPERAAQHYYRLDSPAGGASTAAARLAAGVIVVPVPNDSIGNAFGFAYSRAAGERAFYQYAQWTDRPTFRVAQLLLERLEARASFASVARLGSGVEGDLLVNVAVTEAVHDLSAGGAGVGRIEATIEVIERRARRLLGRRQFVHSAPAEAANAAAGAAAINRAVGALLDDAAPWIEATAARLPRTAQPQ
jgi:cholesterol transport system auxiliary component